MSRQIILIYSFLLRSFAIPISDKTAGPEWWTIQNQLNVFGSVMDTDAILGNLTAVVTSKLKPIFEEPISEIEELINTKVDQLIALNRVSVLEQNKLMKMVERKYGHYTPLKIREEVLPAVQSRIDHLDDADIKELAQAVFKSLKTGFEQNTRVHEKMRASQLLSIITQKRIKEQQLAIENLKRLDLATRIQEVSTAIENRLIWVITGIPISVIMAPIDQECSSIWQAGAINSSDWRVNQDEYYRRMRKYVLYRKADMLSEHLTRNEEKLTIGSTPNWEVPRIPSWPTSWALSRSYMVLPNPDYLHKDEITEDINSNYRALRECWEKMELIIRLVNKVTEIPGVKAASERLSYYIEKKLFELAESGMLNE